MAITVHSLEATRFDELKAKSLQAALASRGGYSVDSQELVKDAQLIFEWLLDTGE